MRWEYKITYIGTESDDEEEHETRLHDGVHVLNELGRDGWELVGEVEILIEEDDSKKNLKEKRGIIKQTLYDGSKKLKHILPKGKHL